MSIVPVVPSLKVSLSCSKRSGRAFFYRPSASLSPLSHLPLNLSPPFFLLPPLNYLASPATIRRLDATDGGNSSTLQATKDRSAQVSLSFVFCSSIRVISLEVLRRFWVAIMESFGNLQCSVFR